MFKNLFESLKGLFSGKYIDQRMDKFVQSGNPQSEEDVIRLRKAYWNNATNKRAGY